MKKSSFEQSLLNSFFIRYNNFVNNQSLDLQKRILLKQTTKRFINIKNINIIFNIPTQTIYNEIKDYCKL